ncbi:MAG: hypothetical protein ACT4OX_14845, partial [Actinomycetota bacterium]
MVRPRARTAAITYDAHGNTTRLGDVTLGYDHADRHLTSSAARRNVAFVVGNASSPTTPDRQIRDWMAGRGWSVSYVDDDGFTA